MPKKQGLYSVVDFVNKVTVVPPTVMMNDLTAALTFFQTFANIKEKIATKPNLQMLCLYKVCDIVEEDGEDEGYVHVELSENPLHLTGKNVKEFIQNEYARLGLDDDFIESEEK